MVDEMGSDKKLWFSLIVTLAWTEETCIHLYLTDFDPSQGPLYLSEANVEVLDWGFWLQASLHCCSVFVWHRWRPRPLELAEAAQTGFT